MQPVKNKFLVLCEPLPPPAINSELEMLSALPRSVECLRYFILTTEFWISPGGRLRHWLKINLSLGAFLFIPAVVLMPIISLVLHEVDGWLSSLVSIAWKFILLSLLTLVVACVINHRHKDFPSSSPRSSGRRK